MLDQGFERHVPVFIGSIVQWTISCPIEYVRDIYFVSDFVEMLHEGICLVLVAAVDELEHELLLRQVAAYADHISAAYCVHPVASVHLAIRGHALVVLSCTFSELPQLVHVLNLSKLHIHLFLVLCHILIFFSIISKNL